MVSQNKTQREIKFRTWMGMGFHYWGFILEEGRLYFQGIASINESMSYKLKHSQQFTGLKDKNGKEIYESCVLNGCYLVQYNAPRFILTSISTGDIIERWEGKDYEITREYVGDNPPVPEDPKRRTNQHLP